MVSKPPADPDYAERGELRSREQCDTVASLVISVWSWALAAQLYYCAPRSCGGPRNLLAGMGEVGGEGT